MNTNRFINGKESLYLLAVAERLSVLKGFENDCYRICYFLLKCEAMAVEAAKYTLSDLIQSDSFFQADSREAMAMLRKESMKAAIITKARHRKRE